MKRKMIQCAASVRKNAIRREQINGVEHIIVSSYTLPDNIVMNGILYPAEEIEKSYKGLERTLAPVEHPVDKNGNFMSASDPEAIHNFHAGAFNVNVTREAGRVHIEKHINVQEALKTDRGKRLLDRINELETSSNPRPIHTSTGLFLAIEDIPEPMTNGDGDQYTMIGSDFVFDHDAILLDSVAAATPDKGVGMAVNSEGETVDVEVVIIANTVRASKNLPLADTDRRWDKSSALRRVKSIIGAEDAPNATYGRYHLWFDAEQSENFGAYKLPFVDIIDGEPHAIPAALRNAAARLNQTDGPTDAERARIRGIIDGYLDKLRTNASGLSFTQVMEQLQQQLSGIVSADWLYIYDVYMSDMEIIFETPQGFFSVPFTMSDGIANISGIPIRVDKKVEFQPKINSKKGEGQMKELILNALAEAGISTDGLSDDQLLDAYNKHLAGNQGEGVVESSDITEAVNSAVSAAVKPLAEVIEGLTDKVNSQENAERDKLVETVVNSKKYPGVDEAAAKALPIDALKEMAANCGTAYGVPLSINSGEADGKFEAPTEMPS